MHANLAEIVESLREDYPDLVTFDGLDECIVGVAQQWSNRPLLVYDRDLMVQHFIREDGMDPEGASEWVSHNIDCLWAGEGTPLIMQPLEQDPRLYDVVDDTNPFNWDPSDLPS